MTCEVAQGLPGDRIGKCRLNLKMILKQITGIRKANISKCILLSPMDVDSQVGVRLYSKEIVYMWFKE